MQKKEGGVRVWLFVFFVAVFFTPPFPPSFLPGAPSRRRPDTRHTPPTPLFLLMLAAAARRAARHAAALPAAARAASSHAENTNTFIREVMQRVEEESLCVCVCV